MKNNIFLLWIPTYTFQTPERAWPRHEQHKWFKLKKSVQIKMTKTDPKHKTTTCLAEYKNFGIFFSICFFLDLPNKPTATCNDIVHWTYETIIYNAWQWYWRGSLLVSLCLNQRKLCFQNRSLFEGLMIVLIRLDMKIYEQIWFIERLMAADREIQYNKRQSWMYS
jgi:hypothetical protein